MDKRLFLWLLGILIATIASEFNDQVTSIALTDVRGGFSISRDPGTWIQSLYVSAQIVGTAVSPWMQVTFSPRRWTLFSIALCGVSSTLIPFSPNIEAIYTLRLLQGLAGGLLIVSWRSNAGRHSIRNLFSPRLVRAGAFMRTRKRRSSSPREIPPMRSSTSRMAR